ncbi:MAG: phage late control D family protein [Deltaproteobacteria bacterium]|nr:phage late control D family protein [Deltaproteobacteria bacterium]MCP5007173.1 phage late control D family protein [Planctomycetota bacterium]
MNFEKLHEKNKGFYVPSYVIEVEGTDLMKKPVEVFGVTVNNTLDGADDFSFRVNNPVDREGEFPYIKDELFDPGKNVTVKIGYGDRKGLKTMIIGIITSVDTGFKANGVSELSIKGYDLSHKMMKDKSFGNFGSSKKPIKFSEIVKKIVSDKKYNLGTKNVEDTGEKHRQIKQDSESDYDFIKNKLAAKIGYEVFVFENELYFRLPDSDKRKVVAELAWGTTLFSFSPKINIANQVTDVEVRDWDHAKQKAIVGKAKRGDEHGRDGGTRKSGGDTVKKTQGKVKRTYWLNVASEKEANDSARSILDKLAVGYITGSGECIGIPEIMPGYNIKLEGMGKKFSKVYYVDKTTHSVSTSGYKTTFSIKESTI